MDVLQNLDLLTVGVVVASTILLGISAYLSDTKSWTNRMFFLFALSTAAWGIVNYFSYQFAGATETLWLTRGILFFAIWQAYFLYLLFEAFPASEHPILSTRSILLLGAVSATSLLTMSPLVFTSTIGSIRTAGVAVITPGPGMIIFGVLAVGLVIRAVYILFRKTRATPVARRSSYNLILTGVAVTFALVITFNFIMATAFSDPRFVPFGALFMFPLIIAIGYAILRHNVFNIKVAASVALVFVLAITVAAEIIFSTDFAILMFRASIFMLVLIAGTVLIRGVIREVKLRELIQVQEQELEVANQQQESLLHFISHEVKGYLAKNEAAFAAIVDEDFGVIEPQLKSMAGLALADTRKGVATVMDILDASNLKNGTVSYNKKPFDIAASLSASVKTLESAAQEKGIVLEFVKPTESIMVNGDEAKIRDNVLRNIVDNSIKYTQKGSVRVEISRTDGKARITVSDTGVGITPEDMQHLFTAGGHGKESIRINVHSTGYGLFIAKSVIEAHGGSIRAESDGAGKGSQFLIELPLS